ncbi:Predicted N-acetyltransferase YhbS [Amycolatopsis marina]|uniref:Predicted N-acetyltransferase YhbS n=1 Tax=Amycolatopsis marina TaxID=490629 RepID=A0A1I0YHH1_9PSEU|nr:GNAT family N-acetyltransferase [Amycolatopsis marina]SFB12819.1 Predicted N-acetyltransferase YhbS [Amycolatopsis marina]
MGDIRIRAARAGEWAEIGELTLAAYQADGFVGAEEEDGYGAQLRDAARRAEHAELLVAVGADDRIVGSVAVVLPGTRFAEISREGEVEFRMLAVAPSARGRGVGALLAQAVIERGLEHGASRIVLCSLDLMHTAHRLYERLGFRRLPERDWEPAPGVRLLTFGLDLAA